MKKINIIDIIVALMLIAVIIIGFIYVSGKSVLKNNDTIRYNVSVEEISLETASQFNINENIYNSKNGKPVGVIKDIKVSEQTENFFDRNTGEYKIVTKIENYKVDLVIETEAEKKDGMYYVGDLKISIGTPAYFRGKNYVCQGRVLGVAEVISSEK